MCDCVSCKLDLILEKLKEMSDDSKAIAALAERVKVADEKLTETIKENKP